MWVIGVLSIVTVDQPHPVHLPRAQPTAAAAAARASCGLFVRAFYWTDDRATLAYDLWVIAILAFVWLTPPDWLGDPMAAGGTRTAAVDSLRELEADVEFRRGPACRLRPLARPAVPTARSSSPSRA